MTPRLSLRSIVSQGTAILCLIAAAALAAKMFRGGEAVSRFYSIPGELVTAWTLTAVGIVFFIGGFLDDKAVAKKWIVPIAAGSVVIVVFAAFMV